MKTVTLSEFPLLPRKKESDKSHFGHTLIVGGSKGMTGAAILSANAAARTGSGLVTLAMPEGTENRLNRLLLEVVLRPVSSRHGFFSESASREILSIIQKRNITACVLGPGISIEKSAAGLARKLLAQIKIPVLLDADGLNSFHGCSGKLKNHKGNLILTPHRKEFERLFEKKYPENFSQRIALAKKLSKIYDAVLVLKGHRTLVVRQDSVYVNQTGNPGMAKGGSGDVLSGVIGAFVSQGLDTFKAAAWGVYFHGRAGDIAVRKKGELGLLASDVVECLPESLM